jgi:hypothetical protein
MDLILTLSIMNQILTLGIMDLILITSISESQHQVEHCVFYCYAECSYAECGARTGACYKTFLEPQLKVCHSKLVRLSITVTSRLLSL